MQRIPWHGASRFRSHGDLLALERAINERTGKLYTTIRVDDVRRPVGFFGSTASEGGWRIAIVDAIERPSARRRQRAVEDPRRAAAAHAAAAHQPFTGTELPTIRSRCRRLLLRPLVSEEVIKAVAYPSGRDETDTELRQAADAADGSVGRALRLLTVRLSRCASACWT